MTRNEATQLAAEGVGSAMLLCIVVGSGVMGERLAGGNGAIALLANSLATGGGLFVLIVVFAPCSGAEFNPLVTAINALEGRTHPGLAVATVAAQLAGAAVGVLVAHAMFDLPLLGLSQKAREGSGQLVAEMVATFGLIVTVCETRVRGPVVAGACIGVYIAAAYWFTASTSFANPAVTLARALTPTFAGIAPGNVAAFVLAQLFGALLAFGFTRFLRTGKRTPALS